MIYILNLPKYACQACGKACDVFTGICQGSCAVCEGIFSSCGKECGDVFSSLVSVLAALLTGAIEATLAAVRVCCGFFKNFINFEGPLGGFVFIALLLNVPSLIYAVQALSDPEVTQCTKAPLASFCKVDAGLAVAHLVFASYFKSRVDAGISPAEGEIAPQRTNKQVRDEVKQLALYDLGVLIYFFVFAYALYRNSTGIGLVYKCGVRSWSSWYAPMCQLVFAWLALQYAFCWSCIQGCMETAELLVPKSIWKRMSKRRESNTAPMVSAAPIPGSVVRPVGSSPPQQTLPMGSSTNYVRMSDAHNNMPAPSAPPRV